MARSFARALLGASVKAWGEGTRTQRTLETCILAAEATAHEYSAERSARIRARNARNARKEASA